jgi:DNA-binding NarL/FixJ family response regulator
MLGSGRPKRYSPHVRPGLLSEQALRSAHRTAVALGAGPLQQEVELLAQRGRLRLQEPADATTVPETSPSASASLGLTRRETEVLALVAAGLTNRQIGQALFISPRTVSVHVARILAKLGVARRGEAAAIAHRLGLTRKGFASTLDHPLRLVGDRMSGGRLVLRILDSVIAGLAGLS